MNEQLVYVPVSVADGEMPQERNKRFPVQMKNGYWYEWERYNTKQTDEQFRNELLHSGMQTWLKPTPLFSLLKETPIETLLNERKEWLISCLVDCVNKLVDEKDDQIKELRDAFQELIMDSIGYDLMPKRPKISTLKNAQSILQKHNSITK
jgi:hypothetical protein